MAQNLVYGLKADSNLLLSMCAGKVPSVGFRNWIFNRRNFEMDEIVAKCSQSADVFYVRGLADAYQVGEEDSQLVVSPTGGFGQPKFVNGGLLKCIAIGCEGDLQGWARKFFPVDEVKNVQEEIDRRAKDFSRDIAGVHGKVAVWEALDVSRGVSYMECYVPHEKDSCFDVRKLPFFRSK